jgi:hypothetical protein
VVPKIHSSLAVLFVDSDILFNHKNLGGLISRVLDNPTKLHVYREGNFNARDFNNGYFGLGAFPVTTEEVTSFTPYHNFILTVHACIYAYTIVSLVLSVFHIPGYNINTYIHEYNTYILMYSFVNSNAVRYCIVHTYTYRHTYIHTVC